MLNSGFSAWPSFTREESEAVSRMLLSNRVNYWTGHECREFETEFAKYAQVPHAVSLANGTLALDLCWKTLGVGPGDEVIVTPRTFVASASSIVNAGATPVFADVDPDSQNITPETAQRVLSPRTKAICCVHLAGWPCDMVGFQALAKAYKLLLVEDCAQAHGAEIGGVPVGGWSDMAAWSFCQDKIMTTGGEGGMVTTKSRDLWKSAWAFKDHGKSWDAIYECPMTPGFRWLHETFGTNWRMIEFQAVIGRIQLKRLADWTARRTANAKTLEAAAGDKSIFRVPQMPAGMTHAFYKYYIFVKPEALKEDWSRDRMIHEINQRGIPCYQGTCPEVYLEKSFNNSPSKPEIRFPIARELGETSLMFLVHPTLTDEEMIRTAAVLRDVADLAIR